MTKSPLRSAQESNSHPSERGRLRRKVYSPPTVDTGWGGPVLGALAITLGVFLVLPLTQMVSSRVNKQLLLSKVDSAVIAPPVENTPPPEPPPEEKPPEEPKMELAETSQPLNLAIPELDFAVGTGGVLPGSGLPSDAAMDAADQLKAFDVSELDKAPTVISSVSPTYPRELLRGRVEGSVVLLFVVDESGRVEDPRIENSTHPAFEQPALDAVRRWKFRPGSKEGTSVKTFMKLPMRFRINS